MEAMQYENFVKLAFGLSQGFPLERCDDPASQADTDSFYEGNFSGVKATIGYSMMIYRCKISNDLNVEQTDRNLMDKFIDDVINYSSLPAISTLIHDFEVSIIDKYYRRDDGKIVLK